MEVFWDQITQYFAMPLFQGLCLVAFITGLVRGFAGFGTGMIFIPAASLVFQPKIGVIMIWIMDSLPMLPILIPALKHVQWSAVLPIALGFIASVYLGVWILINTDPFVLRWCISAFIFLCLLSMIFNWNYKGKRPFWLSFSVGSVAGITGGAASLPVPAILAYWKTIKQTPQIARANIIVFMFITELVAGAAYFQQGLFNIESVAAGIAVTPIYFSGLLIGQYFFKGASSYYWPVAISIIAFSAILGLPIFDVMWH